MRYASMSGLLFHLIRTIAPPSLPPPQPRSPAQLEPSAVLQRPQLSNWIVAVAFLFPLSN
jgi:hypothetical protein